MLSGPGYNSELIIGTRSDSTADRSAGKRSGAVKLCSREDLL